LSIFEGQAELVAVKQSFPNLIFYQKLIIQYPLFMHFFVKQNDEKLAKRLTLGLKRLYKSGSLDHYMREHPLTKNAFPLTKFVHSRVITLANPHNTQPELEKFGLLWPSAN
jgi:hypothetical protein